MWLSVEQKEAKCGFSIVLRGSGSAVSDPVIPCQFAGLRERPERARHGARAGPKLALI